MPDYIYKICPASEWRNTQATMIYHGSDDDKRDGFIHFSTASQLAETAARHFAGMDDLVLVTVDASLLGDQLKWEKSRHGELFPHLYCDLPVETALAVEPLPLENGNHVFPARITERSVG